MEAKPSQSLYGERGAGGKFKKPPSKKPPASPYARPPAAPASRIGGNGWLSKLVDPTYQLISNSATRIFPSFFSKSSSDVPPLLPITQSNGISYKYIHAYRIYTNVLLYYVKEIKCPFPLFYTFELIDYLIARAVGLLTAYYGRNDCLLYIIYCFNSEM